MFNILGFHITEPINDKKKAAIIDKTVLDSFVDFDPQMYMRKKSNEQLEKEEDWGKGKHGLFDEDQLTPLDVRILIRAEEELEQTVNFTRLLPCADGRRYLDCCQVLSYSDNLLQHWEEKHGSKTSRGREVLVRLCRYGVHTKDFVEKKKKVTNFVLKKLIM